MGQLENMIMQKTDYSLPDSRAILVTFKSDDVNLMDFQRFDELHDIGYKRAIEMMDSIKTVSYTHLLFEIILLNVAIASSYCFFSYNKIPFT